MPTVAETIEKLTRLKYEKAVIDHIVEYIDETFMTKGAEGMVLLTEDKLRVPEVSIELFVANLSEMQKQNESAIQDLLMQSVHKPLEPTKKKE